MYDAVQHLENMMQMGVGKGVEHFYRDISEKTILEIGFGNGELLNQLTEQNNTCFGVEASKQAILTLLHKNSKIPTFRQDICNNKLAFQDGHFDIVYCYNTLEYLMNPLGVLLEIKRVLKDGGMFILCWDYKKKMQAYPGLTTYENMRRFLNNVYFKIVDEALDNQFIYQKCENKKLDRIEILDIVNNNIENTKLISDVFTPFMLDLPNDPEQ